MADRPLEYELMMSAYAQIGQNLSGEIDHVDAFVPSSVEEDKLGFDIQIPYLKGMAFQYKRPKNANPCRFSVRYSGKKSPRQLDRMKNWTLKFGANAGFYALPLVVEHDSLSETLNRTAFISASKIDEHASTIRIPRTYIEKGKRVGNKEIDVYCSLPNETSDNWITTIQATNVLGWNELKHKIGECEAGFRMRWDGTSLYGQYHDDYSWHPRERKEDSNVEADPSSHKERFVEARGPLLTRIGTSESSKWWESFEAD